MNKRYWSRHIRDAEGYVPGEQPSDQRYIKLNTNENPYPPSPKVLSAIQNIDPADLRLYPDPSCTNLRKILAEHNHLSPENVFVGNGSDEVLAFSFLAFTDERTPAVFPDITYSFYPVYSRFFESGCRIVPVRVDFTVPLEELMHDDGTVLLTNPNAPTGIGLPLSEIRRVLEANPNHLVLIDEAYVDFGCESAAALIPEYDNLLVVQTCSKSRSLAGMRVGFAFGQESLISALNTVKNSVNSYTLDRIALAAAEVAAADLDYLSETCRKVMQTRGKTAEQLRALGFRVLPSQANFLFVSHKCVPAKALFQSLREQGILVRYFDQPRIDNFLRISIGTDADMAVLLSTLRKILEVTA